MSSTTGIIAEFKRKSPSKGWIKEGAEISIAAQYEHAGAAGVSILTDDEFFGGSTEDLVDVRKMLSIPILRKDFIIDEFQLRESKAFGADVILLIAACLSKEEVKRFAMAAHELGLEVLLEIHEEGELGHICEEIDLVGVNNRDLKTFEVNIQRSIDLSSKIPKGKILISESGLERAEDLKQLRKHGFKGFLMGEYFMKNDDPGACLGDLIDQLKPINEN